MERIKVGDYVEVLGGASAGVEIGEQGVVINAEHPGSIQVIFPARGDCWAKDDGYGWLVMAKQVKLVYRPKKIGLVGVK